MNAQRYANAMQGVRDLAGPTYEVTRSVVSDDETGDRETVYAGRVNAENSSRAPVVALARGIVRTGQTFTCREVVNGR